jgi:hypothetical protein
MAWDGWMGLWNPKGIYEDTIWRLGALESNRGIRANNTDGSGGNGLVSGMG